MDHQMTTISHLMVMMILFISAFDTSALQEISVHRGNSVQISSNSVLVALLDSQYTILSELVEKALLLQTLEEAVGQHNITIFAPRNEALERDLDPEFKRFLLEPGNLKSLQALLLYHVIPLRISAQSWPTGRPKIVQALSHEKISIFTKESLKKVDLATVIHDDAVVRPDGVIHGIERLLIPRSVEADFNRRRSLAEISAVLPESSPMTDLKSSKKVVSLSHSQSFYLSISSMPAPAPAPSLALAPAPGPDSASKHWFDGDSHVKDFIETLLNYGGYKEMADILVNLTSLASEMSRLVSEGYVLTVLAPNDDAMAKLTADELSEPGAAEKIVYYHLIPEYQTEESMYNAVRRFGKINYDTLFVPHTVPASEADGSVKFGSGLGSAVLVDPDIHTDGRISVQGIDSVLQVSSNTEKSSRKEGKPVKRKLSSAPRRGKLLEATCWLLAAVHQDFRFAACT